MNASNYASKYNVEQMMRPRGSVVTSGPSGIDLRISKLNDDYLSEPGTITVAEPAKIKGAKRLAAARRPTTATKTLKSINITMNETGSFKLPTVTDFNTT